MKDIEILEIRERKEEKLGLRKPPKLRSRPSQLLAPEENLNAMDNACTRFVESGYDLATVPTSNGGGPVVVTEDQLESSPRPPEEPVGEELALGESAATMRTSNIHYIINRRLSAIEFQFRKIIYEARDKRAARYSDPIYLQWKLLSQVIDRICFLVYLLVIILAHTFFYPRPSWLSTQHNLTLIQANRGMLYHEYPGWQLSSKNMC